MRELSIEEKAKAYDKAIERANDILKGYNPKEGSKATINYIFPELEENKDDKVRKELINYLKYRCNSTTLSGEERECKEWIAWLEKQDEKEFTFKSIPRLLEMIEPTDRAKSYCQKLIDSLVKEGYIADAKIVGECLKQMNGEKVAMAVMDKKPVIIIPKFRVGDEIATKNEESLTITRIDEEGYWSNDLFICNFDSECVWDLVKQKPVEWKQENVEELSDFENAMMHIGGSFFGKNAGLDPNDTAAIKEQAELLLELTPKTEWSEEDENTISDAEVWLDTLCDYLKDSSSAYIPDVRVIISKLKSLKGRILPKQKWSEEDESMYTRTLGILGKCYMKQLPTKVKDELNWLKSLKNKL